MEPLLDEIIRVGEERVESTGEVDFFAKFGDELNDNQRKAAGYYLLGLGHMGKADTERAKEYFEKSAGLDVGQLWARIYLEELNTAPEK